MAEQLCMGCMNKFDENDEKDLRRIKKKSFYWYKDVISSNGENL